MLFFQAIILGIVEGLTEFLPISSTFHLLFATQALGISSTEFTKFFDVFIQAGAMLPVILVYGREWFREWRVLFKVAISFVPTAVIGALLHTVIKDVFFESDNLMIGAFVIVGVLFLVLEFFVRQGWLKLEKSIEGVGWLDALVIGIGQAAAILPGVSRAGAVIVIMMLLRYRRDQAAKYSFMLAVPTILAAAALDLIKTRAIAGEVISANWFVLASGFIAAAISSFFVIRWFIEYLRQNSLKVFSWYRFFVAAMLVLFGFTR